MRIEKINLLDHYNYVRKDAKQLLQNDFGWRDYGGKHYESIITRFYQSYILPQKFGIDKRYSHCSTLICSGQMSRENALVEVSHPAYDQQRISEDKQYVIKKLGLTSDEFDALMSLPIHEHSDYNSIINIVERFRPFAEIAKFLLGQKLTYDVSRKHGIAVLLDNPFERDNRVLLEASELAKHYDVTLYVMKAAHLPTFEVKNGIKVKRIFDEDIHRLPKRKKLKRYARVIARKGYAVVHANDYLMLDLGSKVKQLIPNSKLIYDSHELFHSWPLNLVNPTLSVRIKANVTRWLQVYYEKKHSKYIDRLITVNDSLATILKKYFNHPYQVVVLRNLPMFQEVEKQNDLLRKYFNIPSHQKILVYIGMHVYLKSRNVTSVMDQVGNRPDVAFVLICKDDVNRQAVADYVKHTGYTNIYFHNLLLPNEMSGYLGECDAGLVPTWNKKDLSYWYALDTKMFNYIMAEIPVLATMQPEYISIVNKYRVGVCVNPDEPNAYINGLVEILKRKDFFVENSIKAKQELNWEKESEKLIDLYKELIPEIVIVNIPESA